jgi:integrase/recombinase XerD
VVASCDLDKPHGVRDRAVLLLLARLGLRASDIFTMGLGDIDWHAGAVTVRSKGRREVRLPLPQDAGEALLDYVLHARPTADTDRVFLCANAAVRPFASLSSISDIVRLALKRAGITNAPSRGAHLLRHSAATAMLRSGATPDAIATVLRHRSTDTTAYYAKIDIDLLRTVAQPWPEVSPC